MKNILWIVCLPLGLMLTAPIDAQQQASQKPKPAPNTRALQNQTELGKLIGIVEQMDKWLERMENRFDRIENRLDRIENRQDALENKMDAKFERMDAKFEQLHNRMDTMFYWFMGIISALVAPIAITLGFDTYRRLRNSPSPQTISDQQSAISDQESAKQATGS